MVPAKRKIVHRRRPPTLAANPTLGFVIAGPLTDGVGPRWVFGGVGAVLAFASLVAYALARGAERAAGQSVEAEAA